MQIGMVGLGRMGLNMSLRLLKGGHELAAFDLDAEKPRSLEKDGARSAASLKDLVAGLKAPRAIWIMLPAGSATDGAVDGLRPLLKPGDLVIDGGNTFYKDDLRRAESLKKAGIRYMDVGVSGGIWGLEIGYCMMVGGAHEDFKFLEPALKTLAPKDGYLFCGPVGAGHFVKMIHNGIEYGLMQAYAEGFEIIKASAYPQDYAKLAHLWNQGSVIRSWLLELAEAAFAEDPELSKIKGVVADSGEGRWTVEEAVQRGVAAPVISASLYQRFLSRSPDSFSNKILAALRKEFGGHPVQAEAAGLSRNR